MKLLVYITLLISIAHALVRRTEVEEKGKKFDNVQRRWKFQMFEGEPLDNSGDRLKDKAHRVVMAYLIDSQGNVINNYEGNLKMELIAYNVEIGEKHNRLKAQLEARIARASYEIPRDSVPPR